MRMPRWFERAFFEPASPLGVIAARTILAVQALWLLFSAPALSKLASWPQPFWTENGFDQLRVGVIQPTPLHTLGTRAHRDLRAACRRGMCACAPRRVGVVAGAGSTCSGRAKTVVEVSATFLSNSAVWSGPSGRIKGG